MKSIRSLGAFITLAILAGALAPQVFAGTMQMSTMTYQGRLRESGLPVTGARSVEIKLCDDPTAGSCVASPWQNVSVSTGLFRTTFSVSGVDLSAKPWYLEVRVGAAGGAPTNTLSPREELTASPYAIYSSSAAFAFLSSSATTLVAGANPQGAVISTNVFIVNGSSVGIGTTNPGIALSLGNTVDRTIGLEASGSGNGNVLTVQAGDAFAGAFSGGDLVLKAGTSPSGTSGGAIRLVPGQAPGGLSGYVDVAGGASGGSHLRSTQTTAPTIAPQGNCGATPVPTITGNSTDMAGKVMMHIDAGGNNTCQVKITFNKQYAGSPKAILLTPADVVTANVGGYVAGGPVAQNFVIQTAGGAGTISYTWYYMVIE